MRISSRFLHCAAMTVLAGLFAPLAASGQGMFLDRGKSGAGVEGTYFDGEGAASVYSLGLGYCIRGIANPWLNLSRSEVGRDAVLRVYEIGIDYYPMHATSEIGVYPVLAGSFAIIDPMPGNQDETWSLGAGLYGILELNPEAEFYPSAHVTYTWIEGYVYKSYGASLSLAFRTGSNSKTYIRGHYLWDDDVDFVGISLGFVSNR